MSVIAEVRIPPGDFELGQILDLDGASAIELETLVPSGDLTVPLFWVYEPIETDFLDTVERYPTVNTVTEVDVFEDRTLFRLDWDATQDHLFQCIMDNDGQILGATGTSERWDFEVRFAHRDALSRYQTCCEAAHISLEFISVYNPVDPGGTVVRVERATARSAHARRPVGILRHSPRVHDRGTRGRTRDF